MQNTQKSHQNKPLKVGVIGLVHDHVNWILGREAIGDIEIVGIVEPNAELAEHYCKKFNMPSTLVYTTINEMLDATQPQAVTAFNMIAEHVNVVELCAPRGIHVMVEKPIATTVSDAEKMAALAKKHHIHLLTNYETTWYGSTAKAYELVHTEQKIGDLRKITFRTGHKGPVEIGCTFEFLEWLTDPVSNGGGALMDFGCYGANLATWLMQGETPETVSCITQHIKPDIYPKVEDEATIILTYPKAQVIIQASWNWPYNRKDMQVYGKTGFINCHNGTDMEIMENEKSGRYELQAPPLPKGVDDPFAFLAKVINENYAVEPFSPSSLENNEITIKILKAAQHAAETGRTVIWDKHYKN